MKSSAKKQLLTGRASRRTAIAPTKEVPEAPSPLATMMVFYVIVTVGRAQDIIPGFHILPVAKIVAALAIIVAIQNRSTLATVSPWSFTPTRMTLLFMCTVVLSMTFSVWRHATFGTIKGTVLSVCVALVLLIKSVRNWESVRRLLLACVFSALVLALSVDITSLAGGRAGFTHDLDPNDFAFVLDSLLPIAVSFAVLSRGFKRMCFVGACLWITLEILRTQSRGGLLGLAFSLLVVIALLPGYRRGRLLPSPTRGKIAMRLLMVMLIATLAWNALPHSARARFETLRHPTSGYNANLNDPTGRFAIWLQTLPLTLRRPWGWGAGAFNTVDGKYGGGRYKAAHNMYLQALVELGFEGLALFLAALISGVLRLRREAFATPEPTDRIGLERRAFARGLLASFTAMCVSGFFLAELYSQVVWTLVILSCLIGRSRQASDDAYRSPNPLKTLAAEN